jgi:hypothetical protein
MATAAEIEDLMTGPLVTWVCMLPVHPPTVPWMTLKIHKLEFSGIN